MVGFQKASQNVNNLTLLTRRFTLIHSYYLQTQLILINLSPLFDIINLDLHIGTLTLIGHVHITHYCGSTPIVTTIGIPDSYTC